MKIFIPEKAKDGLGGGHTFTRNIMKALHDQAQFVGSWKEADIYFIPGPTLAERDDVKEAKKEGKKVILRVDNVPRNSRNRNTSTSRLYDFSQMADEVIYQSRWAQEFVSPFTKKDGVVIMNGADANIFNEDGRKRDKHGKPQYLYSQYSSDPTKQWHQAWYKFQNIFHENKEAHLWIVGRAEFFGKNQEEYHFDFFGGAEKRYKYYGLIEDRKEMAELYRSADIMLLPYFADACSNTAIEARLCGMELDYNPSSGGGTHEIRMTDKKELTLEVMGVNYLKVFNEVLK